MAASAPDLVRVAVIGGGISGLTVVYELIRRTRIDALPLEIRLYEARKRLGGAIRTESRDGFLLEHGADSFHTANPAALRLAVELGLHDELIPAHVERGLLLWWNDALHDMPPGLSALGAGGLGALWRSTLLTPRGKLRAGLERFIPPRLTRTEESIAAFVTRRFGRQMSERVGDPLLAGFFRGDPEALCIDYTFPELVKTERRAGRPVRGMRRAARNGHLGESFYGVSKKIGRSPILSMRGGMRTLVDALAAAIRRNDTEALRAGRRVERLRPAGDPLGAAAYEVSDAREKWTCDVCVLAVPGRAAADLVESFAPEVAEGLRGVPHTSTLTVHLGFPRRAVRKIPEAMGCLVPHEAGRPTSACSFVHREFDYRVPPGTALLRVLLGGGRRPDLVDWDDETAVRVARREVSTLFGVAADPLFADVRRHPRAHPQYVFGHADRMEMIRAQLDHHSGLLVSGSCLYGVAVPDVIENARDVAGIASGLARTRLT